MLLSRCAPFSPTPRWNSSAGKSHTCPYAASASTTRWRSRVLRRAKRLLKTPSQKLSPKTKPFSLLTNKICRRPHQMPQQTPTQPATKIILQRPLRHYRDLRQCKHTRWKMTIRTWPSKMSFLRREIMHPFQKHISVYLNKTVESALFIKIQTVNSFPPPLKVPYQNNERFCNFN